MVWCSVSIMPGGIAGSGDPDASASEQPVDAGLFSGMYFVLDSCFVYKDKQRISDLIKSHGGAIQHSMSKKVCARRNTRTFGVPEFDAQHLL